MYSDHKPLSYSNHTERNARVLKWRHKISDLDFEVKYYKGALNTVADCLSRDIPYINKESNVMTRAQRAIKENPLPKNNKTNIKPTQNHKNNKPKTVNKKRKNNIIHSNTHNTTQYNDSTSKETRRVGNKNTNTARNHAHKNPRGRPRKNKIDSNNLIDLNSESEESDFSNDSYESSDNESISNDNANLQYNQNLNLSNVVYVRDLLEFRKDNIIYFIDKNGKPIDKGAVNLIKSGKIKIFSNNNINELNIQKYKNKLYFGLCININESNKLILKNIEKLFLLIIDKIKDVKNKNISIAESTFIGNIPFTNIIKLLHKGTNNNFKILVCKQTLKYVEVQDRDKVFKQFHELPTAGHRGIRATISRIKQYFYWEKLKEFVTEKIQLCLNCQLRKISRRKCRMPLCLTDCPGTAFERISIDIVGPLPKSETGYQYIFTMQDQLTKFLVAVPILNTETSTIATAFINRFICLFGVPKIVISDRGSNLVSKLMNAVARRFKISRITTTAYNPAANGAIERAHGVIGEYLRNYTKRYSDWDKYIDLCTFCYNNTIHTAHSYTPFELTFGFLARMPSEANIKESEKLPTYKNYLVDLVSRLVGIRKLANENLHKAKIASKQQYDKKVNIVDFEVGNIVYLAKGGELSKPDYPFTGPHEIVRKLSDYDYEIMDPKTKKLQIVHARRLKVPFKPKL